MTPQVVVNGVVDGSGPDKDAIQGTVRQARDLGKARQFNIYMDANDTEIRIDTDLQEAPPHAIYLATYDAKDQTVKVAKGNNKGKKINHRNVIRELKQVGEWRGGNLTVTMPYPRSALSQDSGLVAFVQEGPGGPIIAATKI